MASVSSHQWKNVVVGLGRNNHTNKIVGFFSCVVDHLCAKEHSAQVVCELANNVFSISAANDCHHGHHNLLQTENVPFESAINNEGFSVGPVILEVHCTRFLPNDTFALD